MLVTIVSVANADNTGLDLNRLEKVEDVNPEVARKMLDGGSARLPSDDELETYRKAQIADVERRVAEAETERAGTRDGDAPAEVESTPTTSASTRTAKKATAPTVEQADPASTAGTPE